MCLLGTQPRSLQSLARLEIRRSLLRCLQTRPEVQERYLPTQERSSLGRIVDEFAIPATLKRYLSDFDELPPVRGMEPVDIPVVKWTESWD